MISPTKDFYILFDSIFDYYNLNLFNNELPKVMFVITRNNSFGYYIPNKWVNISANKTDEIAINPLMFGKYEVTEILQTIVHEMCHLWQFHFGNPSRTGYHNKEWADKMEFIGLMPSNTGKEGGNRTGQQMMDYVIVGGAFEKYTNELLSKNVFSKLWYDVSMPYLKGLNLELDSFTEKENIFTNFYSLENSDLDLDIVINSPDSYSSNSGPLNAAKPKNKIKYSCSNCNFNIWGKKGLNLICGDCNESYKETA